MTVFIAVGTDGTTVDADIGATCGLSAVNTAVLAIDDIVGLTYRSHITTTVHIVQDSTAVDGDTGVTKHLTGDDVVHLGGISKWMLGCRIPE